jgi:Plasma-membrane choline transporter
MGSICYGSLFLGPVSFIRQVAVLFRPTVQDEASLICLHECLFCIQTGITSVVDVLVSRFNSWAFTYIGLYGYGYNDAALHATELFQKRGWTIIVSDDLVPNVLLLSSVVLGGVSGCFSQLMEHLDPLSITSLDDPITVAFAVGVVNGIVLTSVLFSVISSAVNAVIVCFATSPVDFDQNHPQLSDDMRNAWREVWPGALDLVDLRIAMASPALGVGSHHPNAADGLTSLFIPPGGGGNM